MKIEIKLADKNDGFIIKNMYPLYLHDLSGIHNILPNKYGIFEEDENIDISYLKDIRKDYEEKLNIIEPNYNSIQKLEGGNSPEVIVFHHTAANGLTPEEINRNHISQGWGAIGYHFYIRKDGKIYRGRPEESVGAHAIGRNRTSIGICLEGNFEEERLTDAQKESLERLPLKRNKEILENIISLGMMDKYTKIVENCNCKSSKKRGI